MAFLHPYFLFGLAGAAVPVLIHLLGRRRARRVPFPSLRLLHAAEKRRRTISRLQRLLSLILRVLAVALLALGLASPVVGPVPSWLPLPRPRAVAVVLDDSLSMRVVPGGRGVGRGAPGSRGPTCFALAQSAVAEALRALGAGDRVLVIPASRPGEAAWARPSEARGQVVALQSTTLAAKLAPALLEAARAFEEPPAPNRLVVVLTDLQAAAWREPPVDARRLAGADVLVVDMGDRLARNLSVDSVSPLTPVPLVGRPVRMMVGLGAFSAEPHQPVQDTQVTAQLTLDGRMVAATLLSLPPPRGARLTSEAAAQFTWLPKAAQDVGAMVALAPEAKSKGLGARATEPRDALLDDDARYCTIRVRPSVRVLIATPAGAGQGPGLYLSRALNPFGSGTQAGISPEVVDPVELAAALARGRPDVAILADCPRLDPAALSALTSFLAGGGGVLIFLGDSTDAAHYVRVLLPTLTADATVTLGPLQKAPEGAPFALTEVNTSREPLSAFANPRAGDLSTLRFTRARSIRVGPAAEVLARFDSGIPALLQWHLPKGRVVLFNTSADGTWGEHVRSAAWVPLIHRLTQHLARPARPEIADVLVGERPELAGAEPPPESVTLVGPDGRSEEVAVQDRLLPEVDEPGSYRVRWERNNVGFAANVDERESDLRRTTADVVRRVLAPASVTFTSARDLGREMRVRLPQAADLSWPLILLALALLLFESVFSLVEKAGTVTSPQKARSSGLSGDW
jgi:hypothetical protein